MIDLLNMDCMAYMATVPDKHFDLACVDPPYGISVNVSIGRRKGELKSNYKKFAGGDKEPPPPEYFAELKRVSKNQIIWGANHFIQNINAGSPCWIVWDKVNGKSDFADCELAYTSFKSAVRMVRFMWNGHMQGAEIGGMTQQGNKALNEKRIHPTQKPVKLYEWLLQNYAQGSDKILDTHLGSGSSAIAAHNLGFDFVGIELDTDYFNAAKSRYENHAMQQKLQF